MDSKGQEFLEFQERLTKTRQGNSNTRAFAPKAFANPTNKERCPVEAYKLYRQHRPSQFNHLDSPFYVAINHGWVPEIPTSRWYKNSPMGHKVLGGVMKSMALKAGISGKKLSNHSLRRTMCTTLLQERVPPNLIAQLSGHKNVASLQHYSVASFSQQREMSHILQGVSVSENKEKASASTAITSKKASVSAKNETVTKASTSEGNICMTQSETHTIHSQVMNEMQINTNEGGRHPSTGLVSMLREASISNTTINFNINYHGYKK